MSNAKTPAQPTTRRVVYVGSKSPTVRNSRGVGEVLGFGDVVEVDSTTEWFPLIDDLEGQTKLWGAPRWLPESDPNALDAIALKGNRLAAQREADMQIRLQAAHTAERRAEIRIKERDAAVAAARAASAATTAGAGR
jgi:hypothetical protein